MHEKDACNNNSKGPSINYVVSKLAISDTLFVVIFLLHVFIFKIFSKSMFSFSKYIWASILKMWGVFFEGCFHFQNVFFFERCFHFQIVKCFMRFFSLFQKNAIVNKILLTKICTVTANRFTDEVVKKTRKYIKSFWICFSCQESIIHYLYFTT